MPMLPKARVVKVVAVLGSHSERAKMARPVRRTRYRETSPVRAKKDSSLNPNYLRQLCNDWGEYVDRAADWTGYPGQSSVVGIYETLNTHDALSWPLPGGGSYRYALPNRHAILCAEMPRALIEIHQAVIRLDDELRGAFTFWYAYSLTPDGRLWDRHAKANFVGLSYEAFKELVQRARNQVAQRIEKSIELAYLG